MKKRNVMITLMVGCLMLLANCSGSETPKMIDAGNNVTGGSGAGTGGGQIVGGDQTTGGMGGNVNTPCPSGLLCTAPAGEFVCTEATSGTPPLCVNQTDCAFGSCTQYEGQGFCVQSCGPAATDQCPSGAVCNGLSDIAFACTESVLWGSPPCETQTDCPFGECILSYGGQNLCIQPCRPQKVDHCPSGTACAPFNGKFYCALPSTGLPDSCSTQNDTCAYGKCVGFDEQAYCTQQCEPELVASCPNGTVCRALAPFGFLCSEQATAIPPVCQSQADCAFGTCIKSVDKSYCTEYCSQPGIDITGSIFGLNGVLAGVEVCVFNNGTANRDHCATTNSDGLFALYGLPEAAYFILSMSKAGYQSNLQLAFANAPTSSLMFTEQEIADSASTLGVTYPTGNTGLIVFAALDATALPVSGFTAAVTPQSGSGPYYADADNAFVPTLTASSTSGWGVFFNLNPANYAIDFAHASATCEDLQEVPVVSGYLTYVVTGCF